MFNSRNKTKAAFAKYENQYGFRGEVKYGRRKVGVRRDGKMYYAIEAGGEVISPWFEELTVWSTFNLCKLDGVYFLTSASGKEIISEKYKKIGLLQSVSGLGRYFAKAETLEGKFGIIDSNGKVGIECNQDALQRLGPAHAVCGKMFEDGMRYGIFAVNGEKVADYEFVKYTMDKTKVVMTTSDGKEYYYSKSGVRIK